MGRYLNSSTSYVLYKGQTEQPYFVDKSQMLSELFPFLDSGNTHICITRPRRFGKTVMANMITAFLGKKQESDSIFKSLKISQNDLYNKYRNQYNVISIDFSKMPRDCDSYTDYIDRIETNLTSKDLFLYWMNGILFFIRILLQKKIKSSMCYF